jgi:hypothetical protein
MKYHFKSLNEAVPEGKLAYLKDVKKGEYLKRSLKARQIYTRSDYVRGKDYLGRTINKYACDDVYDISREIYLKGSTIVWIGFYY